MSERTELISLFSGIGGFELAFENNGFVIDTMCEIDPSCQNILRRHFPNTTLVNDVREIGVATHERNSVDIICGGFPCQDVSVAGKRQGLGGERSGLWFEFKRILEELAPPWAIIENVPGLLSSNGGRDFAVILQGLEELGYFISWRTLDAQFFGVPQRRRRVFIVGHLGDRSGFEVLFEPESMSGDTPKGKEAWLISTSRSGNRTGANRTTGAILARDANGATSTVDDKIISSVTAKWAKGSGGPSGDETQNLVIPRAIGHSGGETLKFNNKVNSITTQVGSETTAMFNGIWEPRSQDGVHRLHGDICPTLNTAEGGQRQPMIGARRLTPLECERLQGFPDNWTAGQSDSARYKQLGNAVAVPVVGWIAQRIRRHMNEI